VICKFNFHPRQLLRPWVTHTHTHNYIPAWWLWTSSKLTGKKSKKPPVNLEIGNS